jgi:uncharacterized protein YukE
MAKKAIDKEKIEREMQRGRVVGARNTVHAARQQLKERVEAIRSNCPGAVAQAFERLSARFLETGQKLQANLDPAAQLFDERFTKRVERTVNAECRLDARKARVDAEPVIRAGKAAYAAHRTTEKEAQKVRREQRERTREAAGKNAPKKNTAAETKREAEEQVVRDLESEAETAMFIPIWNRVRPQMWKVVKANEGRLSLLEAFQQYVSENWNEIQAQLTKIEANAARKLAREQAQAEADQAKHAARARGEDAPSIDYRVPSRPMAVPVPSRREPASSKRPRATAPRGAVGPVSMSPKTVASMRM